jgi:aromatic ring-opening dioxygenase catalytic subunit (LigB family)
MAELVGAFAASHTPVMVNFPDNIAATDRDDIYTGFKQIGAAIMDCRADAVIVVSDDHLHNFFLDNFPAFCIGAGDSYASPAEHWLKTEKHQLKGNAALGAHLLGEALTEGFDPSFSMNLILDHGILTPLVLAGISKQVTIVPLLVNCVQPPMPTMRRCLHLGQMLGRAIASCSSIGRVAILASGGISHDVATPRMGFVNESFDREFLRLMGGSDDEPLIRFSTDHVNEAGNGAEEIRNWLIVRGVVNGARFHTRYYKAMPGWYTGIALAHWDVAGVRHG